MSGPNPRHYPRCQCADCRAARAAAPSVETEYWREITQAADARNHPPPPDQVAGLREAAEIALNSGDTFRGREQLGAALLAEPVPPQHPDDGHPHSWGCRRCGVDPVPTPDRVAGLREALIADLDTFIKYVDNPSMGRDTPAMLEEVGRVAARHAKALRAALHHEDGAS